MHNCWGVAIEGYREIPGAIIDGIETVEGPGTDGLVQHPLKMYSLKIRVLEIFFSQFNFTANSYNLSVCTGPSRNISTTCMLPLTSHSSLSAGAWLSPTVWLSLVLHSVFWPMLVGPNVQHWTIQMKWHCVLFSHSSIHQAVHLSMLIRHQVAAALVSIPAVTYQEVGYTLDRLPVHYRG